MSARNRRDKFCSKFGGQHSRPSKETSLPRLRANPAVGLRHIRQRGSGPRPVSGPLPSTHNSTEPAPSNQYLLGGERLPLDAVQGWVVGLRDPGRPSRIVC